MLGCAHVWDVPVTGMCPCLGSIWGWAHVWDVLLFGDVPTSGMCPRLGFMSRMYLALVCVH
jgi:hypothetical protein